MAFPNITDIVATTIQARGPKIRDNVEKNNAILFQLRQKDRIRKFSGGDVILEELSFAENGNFSFYSGYDLLPIQAQDVITAAQYSIKQAACAVLMSGLEGLQNAGRERKLDLLEGRMRAAESTMANNIAQGIYSDGTGFGGKQIGGLSLLVASSPSTGVVGGIDRAVWTFARNQTQSSGGLSAANVQSNMNSLWYKCVRGKDVVDLIMADNGAYGFYEQSLQSLIRFSESKLANAGFQALKYKSADVVLDGGIGGFAPTNTMYFLNTDYLWYRPHAERDMVPLSPSKREPFNQDATASIIAWAGNMTCAGWQFQGYLT